MSGTLIRATCLAALLVVWQVVATWLNDPILPSPIAVADKIVEHFNQGELLSHLGITLLRVFAAFFIAMAVGSIVGILMGASKTTDSALDGILVLALNIPALVTILLCYIWLGLTDVAAVAAVALNKIPTVTVTLREGARAVDKELLQVAKAFRLSASKTLFNVYLPQLYPYLMAASRNGLALIWKIVLVVELLGRSSGVGFQLGTFFQFFDIASILAYTVAFIVVIMLIEQLIMRPLDRRIAAWRV